MIETQVTIINKLGLHARAAAKFVSCTSAYSSSIQAGKEGNMVDAKSIMSVMMLAAGKGTVLDIRVEGADEEAALEALVTLIGNRFDEAE
ncbi:MAG: HPr family phosphocarrier protein [Halieaceae bacterium]|uniref:HPr family phosphocarrier protein n=1 Tax=Candidatus Seongchinamella marina TaxID=2518990 RepID=A0ABT3SR84_9GAMM|nr:HPr family phosphocarrier protein [Candidatus Seongchinamella marina]MBT3412042.1 HPr family phosphocarrier protein [Halieaceae bacterium]MBT5005921.1 HPr family phosphocarrier protein [Halieaceae bacterium]MBT6123874.1 HPr family phosphocarrier protein [Halieaceae bacterium]MBT7719392.1 HPr family phosphocarrier protein [Halieaceae bacterium]MCX2972491.1 HPr family phosphocarrier protein [Candidatus Seongchinamella marina]